MDSQNLHDITGLELADLVDDVALAVADALLPSPLPPALVEFLKLSDGARLGEVEVFSSERIVEETTAGEHSWQLPGAVIIGSAGPSRALVMLGEQSSVFEVDSTTWAMDTLQHTADVPIDLFTKHGGLPLQKRPPWWAWPSHGESIEYARGVLAENVTALLERGIGTRWGQVLEVGVEGFQQVEPAQVATLLDDEDFSDTLLNYRPKAPGEGIAIQQQWLEACDAVVIPELRDAIRHAPLPDVIVNQNDPVGNGESTVGEIVRQHAFLSLLAHARDVLLARATGSEEVTDSEVGRLARVYLAGHVPVSFHQAI